MKTQDPVSSWYAVYVRSRYEKKVYRLFSEKEVECFLPLAETWRQWSDRRKKVSEPLFRGYVFVRCNMKMDHARVLDTDGVVKFVGINRIPSVIAEKDIEWIKMLVREPDMLGSVVASMPAGQRVQVIAGPFSGLEGVVVKQGRESRIVVYFDSIMQGIEVSIYPELLAPVTGDQPAENNILPLMPHHQFTATGRLVKP
jgi:transcription antitermination factor NusG